MVERKQVSFWRLFVRHFIWVPLIPALVALIAGGIGLGLWSGVREMARDGVEAVAVVTHRRIRSTTDRDGNRNTRYLVRYTFQPSSDQQVEGEQAVERALYDRVTVGDPVPVRFLPRDPGRNEIEPGGMFVPVLLLSIAAIAAAAALFLGRLFIGRKLSILRAARHGEVREARVTGNEATNVQVNGRTMYRFTWTDAAGQAGQSAMMDYHALPEAGEVVRVYVDPRSGTGWWEGDF